MESDIEDATEDHRCMPVTWEIAAKNKNSSGRELILYGTVQRQNLRFHSSGALQKRSADSSKLQARSLFTGNDTNPLPVEGKINSDYRNLATSASRLAKSLSSRFRGAFAWDRAFGVEGAGACGGAVRASCTYGR